jgi:homoserine O-acetyltransferase
VDLFDLSVNNSLIDGFKDIKAKVEVISVDSDWLYPTEQSTEILTSLHANNIEATFSEIKSNYGHDAFLLETGQLNFILSKFLANNVVSDLMKEVVVTIKENADVSEAAQLMLEKQVTHIPVVTDDYKLIGIVTSWDLSKSIAMNTNHLNDIMTTTVKYCFADDSIENVARMMSDYDISSLPVVDEDMKVLGIITTDQISHLLS